MRRPLDGTPYITQAYGVASSAYKKGYHDGVDYAASNNTAIKSPSNGSIKQVGDGRAAADGRGFFMIIQGDDGVEHNLYHLARWHVSSGRVSEGQHVADSDNTGFSTGPHLHWTTRRAPFGYNNDFNPADWLFAPAPAPVPAPPPPPAPATLEPHQRLLVNRTGVNQRSEPSSTAAILKEWPYEEGNNVYNFKGFVRGQDPYGKGNNIWFVGRSSGGYFYSGAFEGGANTTGLPDLTPSPSPIPTPTPDPTPPPTDMPIDFTPDDASVIATYPSPDNDEVPIQVPKFIVIHWWGDPTSNISRQSVVNTMTKDNGLSVHYIVDNSGVYQVVPENRRAQHAGPQGNDGLGIECDPNGGEAMYDHLRLLVANMRVRHGQGLPLKKHSDFMATQCPGTIDLLKIEPISVPPVSDDWGQKNNALLQQILTIVQWIRDKLTGIFK